MQRYNGDRPPKLADHINFGGDRGFFSEYIAKEEDAWTSKNKLLFVRYERRGPANYAHRGSWVPASRFINMCLFYFNDVTGQWRLQIFT